MKQMEIMFIMAKPLSDKDLAKIKDVEDKIEQVIVLNDNFRKEELIGHYNKFMNKFIIAPNIPDKAELYMVISNGIAAGKKIYAVENKKCKEIMYADLVQYIEK